jgi:uncharacterized protein YlaI
MDELEGYRRRQAQRQQALRRLGVSNVCCSLCGETDPIAFEADHLERRKNSDVMWATCKNCHAKVTVRQMSEHPPVGMFAGNPFEKMAHALFGAATYLAFISARLQEIGEALHKLAAKGITLDD